MVRGVVYAWFTVGICPASPATSVSYSRRDNPGSPQEHHAPVLLLQYRYPVEDGERKPGSDWVDSRVVTGIRAKTGIYVPLDRIDTEGEAWEGPWPRA
jgi:hypothetical protein